MNVDGCRPRQKQQMGASVCCWSSWDNALIGQQITAIYQSACFN